MKESTLTRIHRITAGECRRASAKSAFLCKGNGGCETTHAPNRKAPFRWPHLATASTASGYDHALANAGLIGPATLAQHLGLRELFDEYVDLVSTAGRANVGLKAMTPIESALAGGDCIDDADRMRVAATPEVLGHAVRAPSRLGTFWRSFTWGHVAQLDRVLDESIARAWSAGAGPGDGPVTVDVDSTICET